LCHRTDRTPKYSIVAVDIADPLEAAVACDACRNHHCDALLDRGDGRAKPARRPDPKSVDELEEWLQDYVDDWRDHGEGPEAL
jgi:hypothetical protein